MKKLLIATNNKGKVKELQELLKDTGLELITPADINLNLEVKRTAQPTPRMPQRKPSPSPAPADSFPWPMTPVWKWMR